MVTSHDVIHAYKKAREEGAALEMYPSEDQKFMVDSKTGENICSLETYVNFLRKKLHCDFECIYHEHVSLTTIYRCKECGAVIFTGDDERYDPNLKCPVCSDYPHRHYWTKEDVENDKEKQQQLKFYSDWMKEEAEAYKRRKARGGLYDWQVFVKKFYGKKRFFGVELTDFGRSIGNKKAEKPWYKRMIELELTFGKKDGVSYTLNKFFKIPLSPYAFYIKYIYRHTKKCPKDLRTNN